ncbi:pectate lyase [Fulvivirgaceae bacterium LMO-SS25]
MNFKSLVFFLATIFLSSANQECAADQKENEPPIAFPGAEGFGKYTTGGRGGEVYVITNLEDDGPGSLREAIRKKHPRTIVFAVSGEIRLKSSLDINYGDLTIAGQSAPGEGITLRDYPMKIKGDNVIVRYMRFRLGDVSQTEDDAISSIRNTNIIIDHCSMSWGTDESGSFYDNENFTLQWCILSESLNQSVHAKGEHGYGGIWGGKKATFHHNLLAHHNSRNPRFNGARYHKLPAEELVDFRNNVIYNWRGNSSYGGEEGQHNMINNYYKPGPATKSNKTRILEPYEPFGKFFVKGNFVEGAENVTSNNLLGVKDAETAIVNEPFRVADVETHTAENALLEVLSHAGASHFRDKIDARIIEETRTGKATNGKLGDGIIDSQEEVGGWLTITSTEAPLDSDGDGIPDAWEKANKLNPNDPSDAVLFTLDKNYTNIEVYLNSLVKTK